MAEGGSHPSSGCSWGVFQSLGAALVGAGSLGTAVVFVGVGVGVGAAVGVGVGVAVAVAVAVRVGARVGAVVLVPATVGSVGGTDRSPPSSSPVRVGPEGLEVGVGVVSEAGAGSCLPPPPAPGSTYAARSRRCRRCSSTRRGR